uniref:Uncharacterized protein n=3 Tax=Meloidogyne TaxID=189290 RepID=A0A6V7Y1W4_MELEN|nr:unnamed protein product [Meloidogyne enterolobii]
MHANKRSECRIWRAAKDMEYSEYVMDKFLVSSLINSSTSIFLINRILVVILFSISVYLFPFK